jgi:hypothetical protein
MLSKRDSVTMRQWQTRQQKSGSSASLGTFAIRTGGAPFCVFGVSLDGEEDVRTKWCSDCAEERRMYADEDRECMCAEVESVSEITGEWAEVRERGYKGGWKT